MRPLVCIRSLLVSVVLCPIVVLAQVPDRILYNGKILTVDEEFSIASAIAISGERIVAVGDNAAVRDLADAQTQQILDSIQSNSISHQEHTLLTIFRCFQVKRLQFMEMPP